MGGGCTTRLPTPLAQPPFSHSFLGAGENQGFKRKEKKIFFFKRAHWGKELASGKTKGKQLAAHLGRSHTPGWPL